MSPEHRQKLDLLSRCTFLPGSWPKRFVRQVSSLPDEAMLNAKQEYWIDRLYYMYRRQISAMPGDKPGFVNPKPPPQSMTITEQEEREAWDSIPDLGDKRERTALEKLERWNRKVKS